MKEHDLVALLEDLPEQGLVRGQAGTVVALWAEGTYEVEFVGEDGSPLSLLALKEDQLLGLKGLPWGQAS